MEDETRQKQHVARNSKGRISMKMALRITGQMTNDRLALRQSFVSRCTSARGDYYSMCIDLLHRCIEVTVITFAAQV